MMRRYLLFIAVFFIVGCASTKPTVLLETETYYLIPANTPFKAVVEDGGKVEDVVRTYNSYAVDAGLLIKLQEQANSCTINR